MMGDAAELFGPALVSARRFKWRVLYNSRGSIEST